MPRKISISDYVAPRVNLANSQPADEVLSCSHESSTRVIPDCQRKRHADFNSPGLSAVLEKADSLAQIFGGKCLSTNSLSNCKGKNSIRFNCINGHNFYLTEDKIKGADLAALSTNWKRARRDLKAYQLAKLRNENVELPINSLNYCDDSWCTKCLEYFNQTMKIGNCNNLRVVGGLYASHILLLCKKSQHMFAISYNRKLTPLSLTCSDCKKQERVEQRKQAQIQEEQRAKFLEEKQQDLFDKAKRECISNLHNQADYERFIELNDEKMLIQIEASINTRSKELTMEFLQAHREFEDQSDQVFLVYKFLNTPETVIRKGIEGKDDRTAKRYYRKIVMHLHPDKNRHPMAKEAFQKLQQAFNQAAKAN